VSTLFGEPREEEGSRRWIDVSVRLRNGMPHWPDNPPVRIERLLDIDRGDVANVSAIAMGSHTGTHMDAPLHFVRDGKGLDEMDLGATIGRARVIGIEDDIAVQRGELEPHDIAAGERVLFKTNNSRRCWSSDAFVEDFVYVAADAASYLASTGVGTVGIDYLSVGGFQRDAVETHRALLEAGIWIIEGLDLSAVEPGDFELVCLPLLIERSDGAPARPLLRPLAPSGLRASP
jgi:arylformamidase